MLTGPSDAVRFIVTLDLSASMDLKASNKYCFVILRRTLIILFFPKIQNPNALV
jgi:hypothetical protein